MNVLLLEDERDVSAVAVEQLENRGYTVFTAAGVEEARQILKERPNGIDILIADHQVTNGSGARFAIEVKGAAQKTKVVVVSGHLTLNNVEELEAHGIAYFNKPFRYADVVNKLLDDHS
jgi:DNA-binding NtrC family response regulator